MIRAETLAARGKIRVAIAGVTGYTGAELVRYLIWHPHVQLTGASSESMAGEPLHKVLPVFERAPRDLKLVSLEELIETSADVFFLCLPHGQSAQAAAALLEKGKKVIDLSADYRLKDPALYRDWYGREHPRPDLLTKAVYGLSELFRDEISAASLVANPGCYPTAALLALVPLVQQKIVEPDGITIDAKSGLSGAGKKLRSDLHFVEANENVRPYSPGRLHRHVPEMEQCLSAAAGRTVEVTFVPHLIPMDRGISESIYVNLASGHDVRSVLECWESAYAKAPFVRVLPDGLPATKRVSGTNVCELAAHPAPGNRAILFAAIDNLGKGASGQAIQNMNLMFGLSEIAGLG